MECLRSCLHPQGNMCSPTNLAPHGTRYHVYVSRHTATSIQPHTYVNKTQLIPCPVGWGCRVHRLILCKGVTPYANECPRYDIKQSNGEASVMLELWEMQSIPSLPLLPGPLWLGVVAPDRVLSMSQTELNCVYMLN